MNAKYHSNTNFSKMVFCSDDINYNTTCGKIDRANTTLKLLNDENHSRIPSPNLYDSI